MKQSLVQKLPEPIRRKLEAVELVLTEERNEFTAELLTMIETEIRDRAINEGKIPIRLVQVWRSIVKDHKEMIPDIAMFNELAQQQHFNRMEMQEQLAEVLEQLKADQELREEKDRMAREA